MSFHNLFAVCDPGWRRTAHISLNTALSPGLRPFSLFSPLRPPQRQHGAAASSSTNPTTACAPGCAVPPKTTVRTEPEPAFTLTLRTGIFSAPSATVAVTVYVPFAGRFTYPLAAPERTPRIVAGGRGADPLLTATTYTLTEPTPSISYKTRTAISPGEKGLMR